MSAITRLHYEGAKPVRETLQETTITDAVDATVAHLRTRNREVVIEKMTTDSAQLWAGEDTKWQCFGRMYFLELDH